jgi:hypothetical protein
VSVGDWVALVLCLVAMMWFLLLTGTDLYP